MTSTETLTTKKNEPVADLSSKLHPLFCSLIELHGLSDHRTKVFRLINLATKASFSLPANAYSRKLCTINGDGTPVQFCVSLSQQPGGLRLLTEAGPLDQSIPSRLAYSTDLLSVFSDLLQFKSSMADIQCILNRLIPKELEILNTWRGGIWFALGFAPGIQRCKLYLNLKWGSSKERWDRIGKLMVALGLSSAVKGNWGLLSRNWNKVLRPVGFMIDPGRACLKKIKIYFRTGGLSKDRMSRLMVDLSPSFNPDLFHAVGRILAPKLECWPEESLVPSFEIDLGRPLNPSLKVDVGCGFVPAPDPVIRERILEASSVLNLPSDIYEKTYELLSCQTPRNRLEYMEHHQFIGLGQDAEKGNRLNIYLKPYLDQVKAG